MTTISTEHIEGQVVMIRGHRVMLDVDLAEVYQVTTRRLNEQVKRNSNRFPMDFMFQLSREEFYALRSQFATAKWSKRRTPPYAFTEHGAVMAASVLNSPVAIEASVQVVRTFVRLREMLATHDQLARKLAALEKKYDDQFRVVFGAIRQLMAPEPKNSRQIGFARPKPKKKGK